jgi:hypothetical protein
MEIVLNKSKANGTLDMWYVRNEAVNDGELLDEHLWNTGAVYWFGPGNSAGRSLGQKGNSSVERSGIRLSDMWMAFKLMELEEISREGAWVEKRGDPRLDFGHPD